MTYYLKVERRQLHTYHMLSALSNGFCRLRALWTGVMQQPFAGWKVGAQPAHD